jgi:hypothetical protein
MTEILSLFIFLFDSNIQYIYNQENAFFPSVWGDLILEKDEEKLQEIINKLDFKHVKPIGLFKFNMKGKRLDVANKILKRDHIYKAPFDIFKT